MPSDLTVNVFAGPSKPIVGDRPRPFGPSNAWDPMTSTLIYGDRDAVLVDAMTTIAEAEALAAWVKLHNRNLTTIYITHGHLDHFAGLSVLLQHFPDARPIGTAATVRFMHEQIAGADLYRTLYPWQIPTSLTVAQALDSDVFELEGHELRIIEQGRTDGPDSTSLWVPDLGLVVAGDVIYNHCHMYVGEATPDVIENWIAALDRIDALQPRMVVAGHKKPGTFDTPDIVGQTRQYLVDFSREKDKASSDEDLFQTMGQLYPDWASHQAWLMFGF